MNNEAFLQKARQIEQQCYEEFGRGIDGAPYSASDSDFMDEAFIFFGEQHLQEGDTSDDAYRRGEEYIIERVQQRKAGGEGNAQVNCGNWWLWTILNDLGVSRVKR